MSYIANIQNSEVWRCCQECCPLFVTILKFNSKTLNHLNTDLFHLLKEKNTSICSRKF